MNIWIFQTGEPLFIDKIKYRPMRAMLLANTLIKKGHKVNIISTNFFHQEKKFRYKFFFNKIIKKNLKITLIDSPGYNNNIGVKRIYDHFILSRNLQKYLTACSEKPDFGFVGYPPIDFANVAISWLLKNKIPSTIDIKDLWPDIFEKPFRNFPNFIFKPFVWPFRILANQTISKATFITASSENFLKWGLRYASRKKIKYDTVCQLIPDLSEIKYSKKEFYMFRNTLKKKYIHKNKLIVCFVGSITRSFDFKTIKLALDENQELNNFIFLIGGIGNNYKKTKKQFKKNKNVHFIGSLDVAQIKALFNVSDLAFAPYFKSEDFSMNIPNKIFDFIMNSLPVVTTLSGDARALIKKHKLGLIYQEQNSKSFARILMKYYTNKLLISSHSRNCSKFAKNNINVKKNYNELIKKIESFNNDSSIK